ncbi:MAG: rhomboid family intramembrane serine protease [Gaiellaceae bacterium]
MATCYRHSDRETGLSCSECGRPICTDCMTIAPVGIRCPEHAGGAKRTPGEQVVRGAPRALANLRGAYVTRALVIANVFIYLITVAQGAGLNSPGGALFDKWLLYGPYVAQGQWWRLITSAFLHASILHIALNMLALWWLGSIVEQLLGHARYLALYFTAGLAGAAGALLATPLQPTVGASGAIYGILGSLLILEWLQTGTFAGPALTLIVINLAFSYTASGISWGGHIGGLVAGIAGTLAFWQARKLRQPWLGYATLVAISALSVAVAYWKVRGMA